MNLRLLRGGPDYYAVQLDGGKPRLVEIVRGQRHLQLFDNLKPGPHEVRRNGAERAVTIAPRARNLQSDRWQGAHASR